MNLGTFSVILKERMVPYYCFICVFLLVFWMSSSQSHCAQSSSGHHCMLVHMRVLASSEHIKGFICHTEAACLIWSGFLPLLNVDRQFVNDFCGTSGRSMEVLCLNLCGFYKSKIIQDEVDVRTWHERSPCISIHIYILQYICLFTVKYQDWWVLQEESVKNLRMVDELIHALTRKL